MIVKLHTASFDLFDELRLDESFGPVAIMRDRISGLAEGRAQIADDVLLFVIGWRADRFATVRFIVASFVVARTVIVRIVVISFALIVGFVLVIRRTCRLVAQCIIRGWQLRVAYRLKLGIVYGHKKDFVVLVLQIPVVHHSHYHYETLHLFRSDEGIIFPTPNIQTLHSFRASLESYVGKVRTVVAPFYILARLRSAFDVNARGKIINLRHVADGPDQTHCGSFGLRLVA